MGLLQARILEWVTMPSSRKSSQPRDWTEVSHIAGGFFTTRTTRKPKNTGVGSLSLLQGIFPTQGSNRGLWHCRQILYKLSHKGSPRILEWVAYPFTSRSSWPRIQPGVFCITAGFFTNWVIKEAKVEKDNHYIYTSCFKRQGIFHPLSVSIWR